MWSLLYKVAKEAKLCGTSQDVIFLWKRVGEHEGSFSELIFFFFSFLMVVKVT